MIVTVEVRFAGMVPIIVYTVKVYVLKIRTDHHARMTSRWMNVSAVRASTPFELPALAPLGEIKY